MNDLHLSNDRAVKALARHARELDP
jgi:hypothetical protein